MKIAINTIKIEAVSNFMIIVTIFIMKINRIKIYKQTLIKIKENFKTANVIDEKVKQSFQTQLGDIRKKRQKAKATNMHGGSHNAISEDQSRHHWSKGTCLILGDAMLVGLYERKFTTMRHSLKVRPFSGATTDNHLDHMKPLL